MIILPFYIVTNGTGFRLEEDLGTGSSLEQNAQIKILVLCTQCYTALEGGYPVFITSYPVIGINLTIVIYIFEFHAAGEQFAGAANTCVIKFIGIHILLGSKYAVILVKQHGIRV